LQPCAQQQCRAEQREDRVEQKTGDIAEHLVSFPSDKRPAQCGLKTGKASPAGMRLRNMAAVRRVRDTHGAT
jgi:hypothetical protein